MLKCRLDEYGVHIQIEEKKERDLLRALGKAAFYLYRPSGIPDSIFNLNDSIADEDVDKEIYLPQYASYDARVLSGKYIKNRPCSLMISRCQDEAGCLLLIHQFCMFENAYGSADMILDFANNLLECEKINLPVSTRKKFTGNCLTRLARNNGCARREYESDVELRKRLFIDLYDKPIIRCCRDATAEFLFGCHAVEWSTEEMEIYMLIVGFQPHRFIYQLTRDERVALADIYFANTADSSLPNFIAIKNFLLEILSKKTPRPLEYMNEKITDFLSQANARDWHTKKSEISDFMKSLSKDSLH